jgi:lysophospholipase L1-like esterase
MNSFFVAIRATGACAALLLLASGLAAADSVYVGLGDSITFGETDLRYVQSFGDQGYVSKFANILAGQNGGVRPIVANFAIDGETAASFQSGAGRTPPVMGRTDIPLAQQNLNYAANPSLPQATQFQNYVAAQNAAGNSITTISITLGFNELGALANLSPSDALAAIPGTLATYRSNYTQVLSQIRSVAPSATLYLVGYYNPFPGDPTNNPAKPIFAQGGPQVNTIIQGLASQFNATYVDTSGAFLGREAELTYISQYPAGSLSPAPGSGIEPIGNLHPNDAGYTVIANQIASTPEPGSFALVGLATLGFGLLVRRQSRRAAQ